MNATVKTTTHLDGENRHPKTSKSMKNAKKSSKNSSKRAFLGFTLIELMIVVAIIGVLAAIAIPNFVRFSCRSKQSEAKMNLTAIYVAEESYRAEFDGYLQGATAIDLLPAGFEIKGSKIRYSLSVPSAGPKTFLATAIGKVGLMDNDTWEINQDKEIEWVAATANCQ